jgi:hypothetical protein
VTIRDEPFTSVFSRALRGDACRVVGLSDEPSDLPMGEWTREADHVDAVEQTRRRGASALQRDLFDALPGEGRWQTALLADGNVGIGGDPVALLSRTRDLVQAGGRVVAELAEPGVPMSTRWVSLETGEARSRPFPWSVVGVDDIDAVARQAGLAVRSYEPLGTGPRWVAVLGAQP